MDSPKTIIGQDRLIVLQSVAEYCQSIPGHYAEFGVFYGGSLDLIRKAAPGKAVFGIDSFEGLPEPNHPADTHKRGDFKVLELSDVVKQFINTNVELFIGFSPEVFKQLPDVQYAFVHVDVDLYRSVKDAIDYFFPRLSPEGIMVFDDYGFDSCKGAKVACDEFVHRDDVKDTITHSHLKTNQFVIQRGYSPFFKTLVP